MENKSIEYIKMITDFVIGVSSVQEFESNYLKMVKNETFIFSDEISKIIESLFSDVDSYCGNPEIANYDSNDPFADIDEKELRKRANYALRELLAHLSG